MNDFAQNSNINGSRKRKKCHHKFINIYRYDNNQVKFIIEFMNLHLVIFFRCLILLVNDRMQCLQRKSTVPHIFRHSIKRKKCHLQSKICRLFFRVWRDKSTKHNNWKFENLIFVSDENTIQFGQFYEINFDIIHQFRIGRRT